MKFTPLTEDQKPLIIAGPCSAETESQVLETATQLKALTATKIFRAGIWKPRTRPNSFEGMGEVALSWLKKVKKLGLKTCVEVANTHHVELAIKNQVDILWIGARTTTSPFAIQEIAESLRGMNIPVMIKNPLSMDISLWIGAFERLYNMGVTQTVAIHRGFSTVVDSKFRNAPNWKIPIEFKLKNPNIPMICDPSHICGKTQYIAETCQKALDLDFDGLMIESHINPEKALSDKDQQVTPYQLKVMLDNLNYKTEFSFDQKFEIELETLREKIDHIDHELIENLQLRMQIVKAIGKAKWKNKITPLQQNRIKSLLEERVQRGKETGLSGDFIEEIFRCIHTESLRGQTEVRNSF